MAELFKITKKKKLITLFILKLISYLSSFGVSFAYAKYITSPLTADKLKCLITSLIILFFISLISNYFCTKIHELFIVDLKYDIELYYFKQLDNIDFNNLNDMHTGFIYNLIDKTAFSFYRIIDGFLECYLPLIIGIGAFIYMTLKQSFLLGIISLVIFIIAVITRYIMTKDREKIRKELHRKHSLYTGSFIDFASNILTVKKLRIEKFAKDTLRKKADDFVPPQLSLVTKEALIEFPSLSVAFFSEEYTSAPLIFSTSLNVAGAQDLKSADNSVKFSSPGNSSNPLDTTVFASANPLSL